MRYHIITFGCQMNKSDSERVATILEKIGYKKASKIDGADLIVVNMCSVRQSAVDRVFGLIPKFQKLKKKNQNLKTILTGCILKEDRKKFKNKFDFILNIKALPNWPKLLKEKTIVTTLPWHNYYDKGDYLKIRPKYQSKFSALVPISNGCNNFCSYCVIPYVRGPLVCRPHEEILEEIKNVAQKGFKEIWLLGQNVNDYHSPTNPSIDFPQLLKMVDQIEGNFWLRFTSPHPKNFSDALIEVMAKSKKFTPYVNIPLQSGDDEILKKMNRNYSIKEYKNLIQKIKKAIPNISLSTDIIVGFPRETKKQFENTVKAFQEIKFDMAYIAEYSPRPETSAFKLKDNVSKKEKERRRKVLTKILKETALYHNKKYVGKIVEVLPSESENGFLIGKSKNYKTVKFKGPKNLIGAFVKVKIVDASPWGLKGKIA